MKMPAFDKKLLRLAENKDYFAMEIREMKENTLLMRRVVEDEKFAKCGQHVDNIAALPAISDNVFLPSPVI